MGEEQEIISRPGGSSHLSLTMSFLCLNGGAFAYFRKGSLPSFIGGALTGASYLMAATLINHGEDLRGHMCACTTGAVLAGGMGSRVLKTGKFMPAGLVASLGLVSMIYEGKKTKEWME